VFCGWSGKFFPGTSRLRFYDRPYIVIRKGWHIVLELRKFLHIGQGNQIRPGRKYLAKFDEGRSKLFQSHPDPLRPGQFRNSLRLFSGNLFNTDFDLLFYIRASTRSPKPYLMRTLRISPYRLAYRYVRPMTPIFLMLIIFPGPLV